MSTPAEHLRAFLESLGLDDSVDPELAQTPERVADLLENLFSGTTGERPAMSTFPTPDGAREPIVLTQLPFRSMCVHHMLPFFGTFDIAYVPESDVAGFGSFGRVIDHWSRRPQVQERLTQEVARHIQRDLAPRGLLIRCRARQMCVEMRQRAGGSTFVTFASSGNLASGEERTRLTSLFTANDRPI